MSGDEDDRFERRIAEWMTTETQRERDPSRALSGAFERTRHTRQDRGWAPPHFWRTRFGKAFAIPLALVVVVSAVGIGLRQLSDATATRPATTPFGSIRPSSQTRLQISYSAIGNMTVPRAGHTATLLPSGSVLVAGGYDASGEPLSSAEVFDPHTGRFAPTGGMAAARYRATATLLGTGRVLIAGGYATGSVSNSQFSTFTGEALASAELYDPSSGTFSATGSMTKARAAQTATLLSDGRVLIVGGEDGSKETATAEIYDPQSGAFAATGSMAQPRSNFTSTLLADGEVLVAGGTDAPIPHVIAPSLTSTELFDPASETFRSAGQMSITRSGHTATLLTNGRVLIVGGDSYTKFFGITSSIDIFDRSTGQFTAALARMPHTHGAATLLPDGRVLILGDLTQAPWAELYDPSSDAFYGATVVSNGAPAVDRSDLTTTLTADGAVLVAGGVHSDHAIADAGLLVVSGYAPGPQPETTTFRIQASGREQPGPEISEGQNVAISATGSWCMGSGECGPVDGIRAAHADEPGLLLPSAKIGALIERIGSGPWSELGPAIEFTPDRTGQMVFEFNDRICCFADNSGSAEVMVRVGP